MHHYQLVIKRYHGKLIFTAVCTINFFYPSVPKCSSNNSEIKKNEDANAVMQLCRGEFVSDNAAIAWLFRKNGVNRLEIRTSLSNFQMCWKFEVDNIEMNDKCQ